MRIHIPFLFFVSTTVIPVPVLAPSSPPLSYPIVPLQIRCNEQSILLWEELRQRICVFGKGGGGAGKKKGSLNGV